MAHNHHVIFVIGRKGNVSVRTASVRAGQIVFAKKSIYLNFALRETDTVVVAQLVRASDCGSEGRGFEPHHPPAHKLRFHEKFMGRSFLLVLSGILISGC